MRYSTACLRLFWRVRKFRQATVTFFVCPSLYPFARMEQHGLQRTDFDKIWYLNFFEDLLKKFNFNSNLTGILRTLHKDLCAFLTIPR
jgi:hypothetical protein